MLLPEEAQLEVPTFSFLLLEFSFMVVLAQPDVWLCSKPDI